MANLQRGFGAALSTFARVLAGSREQRAREEERKALEEAAAKQEQQRQFEAMSRGVAGAATTQALDTEIAGLDASALAGTPQGAQLRSQAEARRQPLKKGEGRKFLDDIQRRIAAGESIGQITAGDPQTQIDEELSAFSDDERAKEKFDLISQRAGVLGQEREAAEEDAVKRARDAADQKMQEEAHALQVEAAGFARNRESRAQAEFDERGQGEEGAGERGQQRLRDAILSVGGITGGLFSRELIAKAANGEEIGLADLPDERTQRLVSLTMTLADDILARDPDPFRPLDAGVYEEAYTSAQAMMEVIDRISGEEPSGFSARDRINSEIAAKVARNEELTDTEQRIWNALSESDRARAGGGR